jgi:hypothetical protein
VRAITDSFGMLVQCNSSDCQSKSKAWCCDDVDGLRVLVRGADCPAAFEDILITGQRLKNQKAKSVAFSRKYEPDSDSGSTELRRPDQL